MKWFCYNCRNIYFLGDTRFVCQIYTQTYIFIFTDRFDDAVLLLRLWLCCWTWHGDGWLGPKCCFRVVKLNYKLILKYISPFKYICDLLSLLLLLCTNLSIYILIIQQKDDVPRSIVPNKWVDYNWESAWCFCRSVYLSAGWRPPNTLRHPHSNSLLILGHIMNLNKFVRARFYCQQSIGWHLSRHPPNPLPFPLHKIAF